jgi:hypothetical protein
VALKSSAGRCSALKMCYLARRPRLALDGACQQGRQALGAGVRPLPHQPPGRDVQICKEHQRAWHAGSSSWAGLTGLNDYSHGIELSHKRGTPAYFGPN